MQGNVVTTAPTSEISIVDIDTARVTGTWRNVLVNVYRHETRTEHIQRLIPLIEELQDGGQRIGMITVVEPQCKPIESGAKDLLTKIFRKYGPGVSCSSIVFEGSGFHASIVRTVTSTINLVSRQTFPHKIFSSVGDASVWMGPLLDGEGSADAKASGIRLACGNLRREIAVVARER